MITVLGVALVAAMVHIVILHFRIQDLRQVVEAHNKAIEIFGHGMENLNRVAATHTDSLTTVAEVLQLVNTRIGRN